MLKFLIIFFEVSYLSVNLEHVYLFSQGENFNFREDYLTCAFGTHQSPIHIQSHLVENVVMPDLEFHGYHNFLASPIKLTNDGKTVKLTIGSYKGEGSYQALYSPSISGGFLVGDYVFDNLHFHWGMDNSRGSEHVIENVRYPLEMHIVHINSNYSSLDEAIRHKNGFVVLAFFFQLQIHDNRSYNPIIEKLRYVTTNGTNTYLDFTLPLVSLLPRQREFFYLYEGSLTSPPCSEGVTWILFPDPILISFRQMQEFRHIKILENFRELQPVGHRKIYFNSPQRFIKPYFTEYSKDEVFSRHFWLCN